MRWLAFLIAAALSLAASGCVTAKPAIGNAATGDGTIQRTRSIEI